MSLLVGQSYNLTLYQNAVLPNSFQAKCEIASMSYDIAKNFADVASYHAQMLPSLPTGSITDIRNLTYYLFSDSTGNKIVIANSWLSTNPIVIDTKVIKALITVDSVDQLQRIQEILLDNGYNDIVLSVL